jgi:hypothetical protein
LTESSEKSVPLDLERDLPTTPEDVAKLWELSSILVRTSLVDVNRLLAPCWTLEKALAAPLFTDDDEPFEL